MPLPYYLRGFSAARFGSSVWRAPHQISHCVWLFGYVFCFYSFLKGWRGRAGATAGAATPLATPFASSQQPAAVQALNIPIRRKCGVKRATHAHQIAKGPPLTTGANVSKRIRTQRALTSATNRIEDIQHAFIHFVSKLINKYVCVCVWVYLFEC